MYVSGSPYRLIRVVQSQPGPDRKHGVERRGRLVVSPQGEERQGAKLVQGRVVGHRLERLVRPGRGPWCNRPALNASRAWSNVDMAWLVTVCSGGVLCGSIGCE